MEAKTSHSFYPHWIGLLKRGANPTHAGYLFQALLHEVACLLFSNLRVRIVINQERKKEILQPEDIVKA